MDRYVVIHEMDARARQLPGYEGDECRRGWDDDVNWVLYRCDDSGNPVELIQTDQMAPEDASFVRDLRWVPVMLNEQGAELDRLRAALSEQKES